jgi:hypothetical protein
MYNVYARSMRVHVFASGSPSARLDCPTMSHSSTLKVSLDHPMYLSTQQLHNAALHYYIYMTEKSGVFYRE